jgi:hypothetical protein
VSLEEKYLIGNKECILKDDLTLDEIEAVEEFTEPWKATNSKTISSSRKYKSSEVKRIIKIIVKPIDGSELTDEDLGTLDGQKMVLILADYAKKKAIENCVIQTSLQNYTNSQKMQSTNSTH